MEVPLSDIKLYNPHLQGERFQVPVTKRSLYEKVLHLVKRKMFIVGIVGLRRVGKTVLIKQILNNMLDGGRDVFYFSFDEERYANSDTLNGIIQFALRTMDNPIIALDEIGKVKNWAGTIKKYYDTEGIKFLVSGSASLEISKGKESLAGRIYDVYLPPLQYIEYLNFIGVERKGFILSLFNPEKSFLLWNPSNHLQDFLIRGGFPEIIWEEDEDSIRRYILSNCIEKIIFEDLVKVFRIIHENVLYRIWEFVVSDPGLMFVPANLQQTFGISKDTILKYVFYLQNAFLLRIITRDRSPYSRLRKGRKLYPTTPSMAYLPGRASQGKIAEASVFDKIYNGLGIDPTFHRDRNGREVDFIVNGLPLEVKYRREVTAEEFKGILSYMDRFGVERGIVVTRDSADVIERRGKTLLLIPLEMFLLINEISQR